MWFKAWPLSIPPFQHFSYHSAPVQLLPLHLQLALLEQRSLFPHNPRSIFPSLCCLRSALLVMSPPQAALSVASYPMLQGLGTVLHPSRFSPDSLDDVFVWSACQFDVFACPQWPKVYFRNIDHCILCWLCWWMRCWMLQDMDHIVASCVIYVEVGTLNWLEQRIFCVLTITTWGIAMLTVHHDMVFSVCIM